VQHRRIVTWLRYIVCTVDLRHTGSYSDIYRNIDAHEHADRHTECFTDVYARRRNPRTVDNWYDRTGT